MICVECKNQNVKSKVFIADVIYDLQIAQERFFDEEGVWHCHDKNPTKTHYTCSNGHSWVTQKFAVCWCGI